MQSDKDLYFLRETNQLLFSASKSSLLGILAISLVMIWSLWDICSQLGLKIWFAIQLCIILIRAWVTLNYYQQTSNIIPDLAIEKKHLKYFCVATILSALHWVVLIILLYPHDSPIHEAFVGVLIAGLTAGGAISLMGSKVGPLFIAIVLTPAMIQFFLSNSELINVLSMLVFLFLGIVLVGVRKATAGMVNNMELRFANEAREKLMKEAKEKAEVASQAKSRFLATMSHEIRTPLNSMLGMADLLSQEKLSKEQSDYTQMIIHSGNTLLTIINDILDFSKIEAGKMEIKEEALNLYRDIGELIKIFQTKLPKNVQIIMDYEENCPLEYLGDAGRMRQILLNLLSNAIKFTPKGEIRIQVSLLKNKTHKCQLQILVADSGIGMDKEFLQDLFKPFTQKDDSFSRKYAGTGLGLAICKQLIELMGGKIWAKSTPNQGSQFFIRLWLKKPLKLTKNPSATIKDNKQLILSSHRVLLVEDVKMNRILARAMLKNTSLDIEEADNGAQAIELYQKKPYDLILMDCQMPIMDGFLATQKIRQFEQDNHLKHSSIIALTANAFAEDREKCLQSGMDDFIAKPYKQEQLLAMLAKYLGEKQDKESVYHEQ